MISEMKMTVTRPLKVMNMGDSLAAGMQDYAVTDSFQRESFSAHVSRQLGAKFRAPQAKTKASSIFKNGSYSVTGALTKLAVNALGALLPKMLMGVGLTPPSFLVGALSRLGDLQTEQSGEPLTNLGVPGFESRHMMEIASAQDYVQAVRRGEEESGSLAVLIPSVRATLDEKGGHPSSGNQLEKVIAAQPDLVTINAPANDFLAAMQGEVNDLTCTPFEDKRWLLNPGEDKAIRSERVVPGIRSTYRGSNGIITRLLKETEAHVMLFNFGELSSAPHYLELGKPVGDLPYRFLLPGGVDITDRLESFVLPIGVKSAEEDGRKTYPQGSRVTIDSVVESLTRQYAASGFDSEKMWEVLDHSSSLFAESEVADTNEIEEIMARVERYNAMAKDLAKHPRIHLVDMTTFDRELEDGVRLKGEGPELKAGRSWGGALDQNGHPGIYSDDGLHPNALGHAMVANVILETAQKELSHLPRFEALKEVEFVDEKAVVLGG